MGPRSAAPGLTPPQGRFAASQLGKPSLPVACRKQLMGASQPSFRVISRCMLSTMPVINRSSFGRKRRRCISSKVMARVYVHGRNPLYYAAMRRGVRKIPYLDEHMEWFMDGQCMAHFNHSTVSRYTVLYLEGTLSDDHTRGILRSRLFSVVSFISVILRMPPSLIFNASRYLLIVAVDARTRLYRLSASPIEVCCTGVATVRTSPLTCYNMVLQVQGDIIAGI